MDRARIFALGYRQNDRPKGQRKAASGPIREKLE
jgi:hypothetical protein